MKMSQRLLVADSAPVVHCGLQQALEGTSWEIVSSAYRVEEVRFALKRNLFDLLVTDFSFVDGDCFDFFDEQGPRRLPTVIFTGNANPAYVAKAREEGFSGVIMKSAHPTELIAAINQAAQGQAIWSRRQSRLITGAMSTPRLDTEIDFPLTQRELDVLQHVAKGLSNKQIGETLTISDQTVKEHVRHILQKLGVADRTQAAVLAVRRGVI